MNIPPPVLPSPRFPKQQVETLIKTISGVQCVWSMRKRPHLGQRPASEMAWILMTPQTIQRLGVDEVRYSYNTTTGLNDVILVGQRSCTLVLRCESYDSCIEGHDLAERVAFRMRTQTARALMVPTISLRDIPPIRVLPEETVDVGGVKRALFAASADVRLNYVVSADPLDPDEGNWISQVAGGGVIPSTLT